MQDTKTIYDNISVVNLFNKRQKKGRWKAKMLFAE